MIVMVFFMALKFDAAIVSMYMDPTVEWSIRRVIVESKLRSAVHHSSFMERRSGQNLRKTHPLL